MRRGRTLLLALALLLLPACVQVEEDLAFGANGSGTYELRVTWDAALFERLVDLVGPDAASRLSGRAFPLTLEAWRDGLEGVEGLQVRALTLDEDGGERTLHVQVRFRHLRDLFLWEPFARRTFEIRTLEAGEHEIARAEVRMDPLARVPWLDPLAAALATKAGEPREEADGARELDPPPFERLGIPAHRAEVARAILAPRLRDVRLAFRVRTPGNLQTVGPGGKTTEHGALFALDFEDLRRRADRRLRLVYRPLPFEPVPTAAHEGDRGLPVEGDAQDVGGSR